MQEQQHTNNHKRYYWRLAGILIIALLLRIVILQHWLATPYALVPVMDEEIYHDWASQLVEGTYQANSPYEFPPLPAYLFSVVYRVLGIKTFYIRVTNVLLGVLTCLMLALITEQLANRRSALLAAVFAALYLPFVFYNVTLLKTSAALFLMACTLLCILKTIDHPAWFWPLLLGITAALALHIRGNFLVLMPIGLVATIGQGPRHWRRGLLFLAGAAMILTPFIMHNVRTSGHIILSTTQSGFNFYLGNQPDNNTPYYRPVPFAAPNPHVQGVHFTVEASRRSGQRLSAAQASRFWYRETLQQIGQHPVTAIKRLATKGLGLCTREEISDHFDLSYLQRLYPFLKWPLLSFTMLFPLGMAGLFQTSTHRGMRWMQAVFLLYAATLVLFFTSGRYRIPLVILLIPSASIGLVDVLTTPRTRARIIRYAVLIILALIIEYLPLPGTQDHSAARNLHGTVMDITSDKVSAAYYWKESVQNGGDFIPLAHLERAKTACRKKQLTIAESELNDIPDTSFALAQKLALLAQVRVRQHRYPEAIGYLQRSLAVNTADLRNREFLIRLLESTDPAAAKEEQQRLGEIQSFYSSM